MASVKKQEKWVIVEAGTTNRVGDSTPYGSREEAASKIQLLESSQDSGKKLVPMRLLEG